jgi:clusterin-associated protein 1
MIRPAFMDEYERLEKDLIKLHTVYIDRLRNLEYLENELEVINLSEQKQQEAKNAKKASRKDGEEDDDDDTDDDDEDMPKPSAAVKQPTVSASDVTAKSNGKVVGGLQGGESDSESASEGSEVGSDQEGAQDEQEETYSDREF